jgi:hypothetical protein
MSAGGARTIGLGVGTADGWNRTGTTAYVTTETTTPPSANAVGDATLTITGYDALTGEPSGYQESQTSRSPGNDGACGGVSTATAVGPTGQIGWALGGCSTAAAGRLTYAFRANEQLSLAAVPLPASDDGYVVTTLQYTPAGTAVLTLTHQDCEGSTPIAVVRGNGAATANLPGRPADC